MQNEICMRISRMTDLCRAYLLTINYGQYYFVFLFLHKIQNSGTSNQLSFESGLIVTYSSKLRKFLTMSQVAIFEKPCEKVERYLSNTFFSERIDKWNHKFQSWSSWQQVYLFSEYGHIIMNHWKRIVNTVFTNHWKRTDLQIWEYDFLFSPRM